MRSKQPFCGVGLTPPTPTRKIPPPRKKKHHEERFAPTDQQMHLKMTNAPNPFSPPSPYATHHPPRHATHHPPHLMAPMPRGRTETQHTHHGHKVGGGRGYDALATRRTERRTRTGRGLLCAPVGEVTPEVDILGPKSRRWEGSPTAGMGVPIWTHLATSEGRCSLPC